MSFVLNNVTTQDAYVSANTLEGIPPTTRVTIDVYNAAIFWSIQESTEGASVGTWTAEVFMGPSSRTIVRKGIVGVRVRSAAIGKPAQVTVEAMPK